MLAELTIRNIALIEQITISFEKGFHVLCGETGAGKSIIIDSMNFILGARGDRDLIRHGAEKATVQALFLLPKPLPALQAYDLQEEGEILLSREISLSGRSVCRLNGTMITLTELREIAGKLVHLCGQNNQQELLEEKTHLALLDAFAGPKIASLLEKEETAYHAFQSLKTQLNQTEMNAQEKLRRLDMLEYQIAELQQANLSLGEEESLQEERHRMQHAERFFQELGRAKECLKTNGGVLEQLSQAMHALSDIQNLDRALPSLVETLETAYYNIEDAADTVSSMFDAESFDPKRLDEVEDRLALLSRLKRKYGGSEQAMLDFLDQAQKEKESLLSSEETNACLKEQLAIKEKECREICQMLTDQRKKFAAQLEKKLIQELADLGMNHADFQVEFLQKPFGKDGQDQVRFLISVNPGQPLRSLAKVASGGEASRIMLAFKHILADREEVGTLIFDEIDTGISGRMAGVVAEKMAGIAALRQVICVTHSPQLAAMADVHCYVEKVPNEKGTVGTKVSILSGDQIIEEVARLSGGTNTALAKAHAKELLDRATAYKASL